MIEEKREFIYALRDALRLDPGSGVRDIEIIADKGLEIIVILYRGGRSSRINATGNSGGANALEIIREVYFSGAHGRMR